MKIPLPFKVKWVISQKFGQNLNEFYMKDGLKGHQGMDFPLPIGTPLFSSVNGTVIAVSRDLAKGEGVAILSSDIFEYKGKECLLDTIYWHMKDGSILVNVGDKVTVGQPIGLSGNTGRSTGPHLHFSIIPMATDGSRRTLESINNGYKANVDPMIWLDLPDNSQKFKDLQTLLNKYGANLIVDGKFGKLSKQALDEFLK